jgi:hypothetical protein
VAGGVLDVSQAHAGVQDGGHERMPEAMRAQGVGAVYASGPGQPADHPEGGGLIEPTASGGGEQRAGGPAGEIIIQRLSRDRGERHGRPAAALAGDVQNPVPTLSAEVGGPYPTDTPGS